MLPDVIRSVNLTGWVQTCEVFQQEMTAKLSGYSLKATQETESGSSLRYPLDGADCSIRIILLHFEFIWSP